MSTTESQNVPVNEYTHILPFPAEKTGPPGANIIAYMASHGLSESIILATNREGETIVLIDENLCAANGLMLLEMAKALILRSAGVEQT